MNKPVKSWVAYPSPCKAPDCKRIEHRAGLCREHWARERARLVRLGRVTG
jgi:hypothetical protein